VEGGSSKINRHLTDEAMPWGARMNAKDSENLTEKQLAESFEKVQRDVAEQIRKYEQQYPELARPARTGNEVVRQPTYSYDVHAAS